MKGNPFKKIVGGHIEFEVGQTHDNVLFKGIVERLCHSRGFNLKKKTKNDNNGLTYECKDEGWPWRLYASNILNNVTMQVKTYNKNHECHKVYRSEEARSKWISSKFETIVKHNPDIKCGVIADLLRHRFNITIYAQRL
ncbi:hypothetical protein Ddye_021463 [Dipteronia dyeriana]|uniref:Transposase MuDR plant domain-containing protein n=1 Tax=Dipteronia dyeriana TaxID=168575 RepID=A0AAD9U2G1_9ROSI|nr:hypothetical protein Ddye_021463 [Dipteronia dyeriana]